MRQGLAADEAVGSADQRTYFLALLADSLRRAGDGQASRRMLEQALMLMETTGERCYEAELHRLEGALLLDASSRDDLTPMQGDPAEACLREAVSIARRQGAKSFELRAVTSLARLWQREGKIAQARQALSEIYGWFTEGFDTADLRDAKALLEELT
jgi:adenylate cyclase